MKKALFIGALLATCAVAGVASASENPCLGSWQNGGVNSSEKMVGLIGGADEVVVVVGQFGSFAVKLDEGAGDIMRFVGAHGAFDNMFGRLEYSPIILKVDMDFIDPFEGIKKLLAMAPIEQTIMLPIETGIIVASKDYGIIAPRDGDPSSDNLANNGTDATRYVDKVLAHLNAGDEYPLPPARKFGERHLETAVTA